MIDRIKALRGPAFDEPVVPETPAHGKRLPLPGKTVAMMKLPIVDPNLTILSRRGPRRRPLLLEGGSVPPARRPSTASASFCDRKVYLLQAVPDPRPERGHDQRRRRLVPQNR